MLLPIWLFILFGSTSSQKLNCNFGDIKNHASVEKQETFSSGKYIYCGVMIGVRKPCESSVFSFVADIEDRWETNFKRKGHAIEMGRLKDRCVAVDNNLVLCACTHLQLAPCNTPQWLLGQLHPNVTPKMECLREKVFKTLYPNEEDEQVKLWKMLENGEKLGNATKKESKLEVLAQTRTEVLSNSEVNKRLGTFIGWGPVVMSAVTVILIFFSIYIIYLSAIFELNHR